MNKTPGLTLADADGGAAAQPRVLVTGGAGFVGSHTCKALAQAGFLPVVYDNLSNGVPEAVLWGPLEIGNLEDEGRLASVIARYQPVGVLHFAAFIEAGLSVQQPERFYRNNVAGTLSLLRTMQNNGVTNIVFSSTAAVYGEPDTLPISEKNALRPVSPYGRSKLMVEDMIADVAMATDLRFSILRYFNAAGADPLGELAENHDPETHLIPVLLEKAFGTRDGFRIFGTDYDTPDGTCVRDFVHVSDLADAHVTALQMLLGGTRRIVANLGNGRGFSVREVIHSVERVIGRKIPIDEAPRRPGDPAILVADNRLARELLNWRPRFGDLDTMVAHAAAASPLRATLAACRPIAS